MTIPSWAQSSVDQEQVSLTIVSVGKAGTGVIALLGMLGIIDPLLAKEAWGNFVAQYTTLIPALYAAYHSTVAIWGVIRKAGVRLVNLMSKPAPTV